MEIFWDTVKDFLFLSLFLIIAIILKSKIKFFQRFLIPTAIIGGFIGLILGSEVLKLIKLSPDSLGKLVYHLMAIGFIALALKDRKGSRNRDNVNTGFIIVSTYLAQGILGFIVSLALAYTIFPNLFPPFGLLLPLGFAQGPGQAYSIGSSWEEIGLINGGNIGLSIATIGFLWAIIFGIPLLNYLVRRKKRLGLDIDDQAGKKTINDIAEKHTGTVSKKMFIDNLTVQLVLIGFVYLLTYFTLKGISILLEPLGTYGNTVANLFWGFHFVVATMIAILVRIILNILKRKNWLHINYPDNYILQRVSASSFDYMIVAAISAISIVTFRENWIPITIITTLGGLFTIIYAIYISKRVYKSYVLEHIVALYGMLTGTITTGVALLREIDPDSKSNVAENIVIGSAVALPLGIPLMFILGLAVTGHSANKPILYLYSLLIFIAYLAVLLFILLRRRKKSSKQ